jgi:membrane-bound lytic murein transglycosylase A
VTFDAATEKRLNLKYGRLLQGKSGGYFTRREIEEGALQGRGLEIVWLKSWVDAFFIHVQGSGRIRFEDGSAMRLAYGAKSGQPYTGIGGVLAERGVLTKHHVDAGPAPLDEGHPGERAHVGNNLCSSAK